MKKGVVTAVFLIAILFNGAAQPNVAEWIKKFNAYQSVWKKTSIHLTLNQDKFSPGDTVWFKAHFLTEDLKGVDGKQLIDLNLVDAHGNSKLHLLFTLRDGLGSNQFALPDTLSPGFYLVTAHSSWMKNFGPAQFFRKTIQVVRENKVVTRNEPQAIAFKEGGNLIISLIPGDESKPARVVLSSPPTSHLRNENLTIIMTSRGRIYHTASFIQGTNDSVSLEIPQADLDGIAQLSLLDQTGVLLASRDFYNSGETGVKVNVDAGKYHFHRREKVALRVSLTDRKGRPVEGEFSISVRNAGLFDSSNEISFAESNILAIPWKQILSRNQPKPSYGFTAAVRKTGKAYYANTLQPVPDNTQIMFYLQNDMMRYQTSTTDSGKVWLTMPDVFEPEEFFYVAETGKGKEILNLKIEWENESFQLPSAPPSMETNAPDPYASFVSKIRLIDRSYEFYASPETIPSQNNSHAESDFEYEIGGADITIDLERYIVYPTMQELIKEVIPSLFHRTRGGKDIVRVNLPEPMMTHSTGDPVYIIDGIATKNTDFFLSLSPSDLLRIKIVKDAKKLAHFGLMGKNGIVIVETKTGDIREPLDDPGKLVAGINRAVKFNARDYSVTNDLRRPDFRSTIHWDPSVKTDKNGNAVVEFFCSDDLGRMDIRINGLTASGQPFSADYAIEILNTSEK